LDFTIISFLIFLHSLLGIPWVVGATILSISHVQSLYIYSSQTAPGERPKFIGVR
jgi:sodium bicarbonate cotransporter 7/sodium bicarbonate transporter 10